MAETDGAAPGASADPSRLRVIANPDLLRAEDPLDPHGLVTALQDARVVIGNLSEALRTRTIIGQATGLLMSEGTVSDVAAFAQLRETSSHTNVKIRDIASRMVREANESAETATSNVPSSTP